MLTKMEENGGSGPLALLKSIILLLFALYISVLNTFIWQKESAAKKGLKTTDIFIALLTA